MVERRRGPEPRPEQTKRREVEQENEIERAFALAGIKAIAPKVGTKAYMNLETVAKRYIATIIKMEDRFRVDLNAMEQQRRTYHEMLCVKIYGITYSKLDGARKDAVSNFAAYLANRTYLVDTW